MSTAVVTTTENGVEKKQSLQLFSSYDTYESQKKVIMLRPAAALAESDVPLFVVYGTPFRWKADVDLYPTPGKFGHKSLTKVALRRLCGAANISILGTQRLDDRRNIDYSEYSATVSMRMPDGSIRYGSATADFPVQAVLDQEEAAKKKKGKDYDRAGNELSYRRYGARRCESMAINRALRDLLIIQSSYPDEEVALPFIVPVVVPNTAYMVQFPEGRQAMFAQALGATPLLYPSQTPPFSPQLPPPEEPHARALPSGPSSPDAERPAMPAAEPEPEPVTELPDFDEAPAETEKQKEIRGLWETRKHAMTPDKLETMLAADEKKQQGYIDWMGGFPRKEAPAAAAATTPTNGQGAVGWEPSEAQTKRLYAIAKKAGYNSDAVHELIARQFDGITSTKDLTREQYDFLCGDDKSGIESWLLANPAGGAA